MNTIEIKNLKKSYGKVLAVDDVSFEIKKGEVLGFIGPNGAGKSTTIRCIMNMLKFDGEIKINNKNIQEKDFLYKENIGYLPSETSLYEEMNVIEMLEYSAGFYKKDCSKKIKELVEYLEIPADKKIEDLSLGNTKKVGIVIALMHEPNILILDEPTSGLDPLMQEKFYELIIREKEKGTTIFFSSHLLSEVKRICDRIAIIKNGKIIEIKNTDEFGNEMLKVKVETDESFKLNKFENLNILSDSNGSIEASYKGDINELIKLLSEINIKKLIIEEPSIEELFFHYYEGE